MKDTPLPADLTGGGASRCLTRGDSLVAVCEHNREFFALQFKNV